MVLRLLLPWHLCHGSRPRLGRRNFVYVLGAYDTICTYHEHTAAEQDAETISVYAKGILHMAKNDDVPLNVKLTLTIKEAAQYSGIGINRLEKMLKTPNCPFVLFVGTRKLVKREAFEQYLKQALII